MTLRPPEIREAVALIREHRKAVRAARPKPAKRAPRITHDTGKQDRGRVRDAGFLAFLRRQPCAVGPVGCAGPIEAAHVRYSRPGRPNPGLQVKPSDRDAVPLCSGHHRTGPDAQHGRGERAWWAAHSLDPFETAERLYAAYLGETNA